MSLPAPAEPVNRSALRLTLADYCQQSRRPLASLIFVLPWLVLYEGGVLLLGPAAVRNGADVWLRQLLDILGLTGYFFLPLLTVAVLLGWHHTTHQPWRVSPRVLYVMLAESALLAFVLLAIGYLQWDLLARITATQPVDSTAVAAVPVAVGESSLLSRFIGFCGAGIYEEVLFRLLLLPLIYGLLAAFCSEPKLRATGAVLGSSLIFAAAHYIPPQGDTFAWSSFLFRTLAGSFFAILFVCRGFGITAGCHALYDIFVGIL